MVESGNLYTKPISSEKEFEMEISCRRRVGTAEGACGAFHRKTKRCHAACMISVLKSTVVYI
jgi:hypothetical protein